MQRIDLGVVPQVFFLYLLRVELEKYFNLTMPAIPVIPYDPDQALDDEMQKQVGELGKEVILKGAKDSSGKTLFQNLLESTKDTSQKGLEFLGNFIWGGSPQPGEAPRDMQGTQMVPDPQNPGQFIHPGALQIQQRDSLF